MFMGSGKIDVDIMALHDLKGAIKRASEGMTDISQSVDSYLEETLEHMQRTIDFFRQKLEIAQREVDKAEAALSKAQAAYDACLRSQREVKDEDGRTRYVPSCAFEGGRVNLCRKAVEAAERVRDEWKKKVDAAERIKSDCKGEIDRYHEPGGFVTPPGGRKILLSLARDHSDRACAKLDETIAALQDIQSFSFETGESRTVQDRNEFTDGIDNIEQAENDYKAEKREKFEDAKERVDKQIEEKYGNTTEPNIFEICPKCGKFKYINCTCAHTNER